MTVVTVFAGCLPFDKEEEALAAAVGRVLGKHRIELRHGGYNGLMEIVAAACRDAGGHVRAPLIVGVPWGEMNPSVHEVVVCHTPAERLRFYLDADVLVALPGGVGTVYEIAAALWHTTSFEAKPLWLLGRRSARLLEVLQRDRWIVATSTRPTAHIELLDSAEELDSRLRSLVRQEPSERPRTRSIHQTGSLVDPTLAGRVRRASVLEGAFQLPTGEWVDRYFDEYRVISDSSLMEQAIEALLAVVPGHADIDAIAGIATAGLPFATLMASRLKYPLFVVRHGPRSYGTASSVEGGSIKGRSILVVDSVLSTGRTVRDAVACLATMGANIRGLSVLLDRGRGGRRRLAERGVAVHAVLRWSDLLQGDGPC
jgi:orotate phosphoribosyltransferase